ncbi:PfkB family carbohydrate kinase [Asanoa sp. WMMD1127]|uniref:PfkB family carbohydrate kinase n=1 Tax=Asanoa sp. WMMD1127 TaxID=3016107 RepID=UPI0024177505|nr:PfkB family carbohydrate kinase [Asanoa sp. WMMD1127]MDG4825807.1 PfkB family carbohydrate kinase [Asanoa sp. WMMD1127]
MTAHVVVVGDVLLDRDVDGTTTRLVPDGPGAPVLDETSSVERAGGAGLAASFAAASGARVSLVTALADDEAGARLAGLLTGLGIELFPLPVTGGTTVEKIRLRAGGRTLLRLDRGGGATPADPPDAVTDLVAGADAVLVSCYGNGLLRVPGLRHALAGAGGPVVWDPHPRGPIAVPGVALATPNEGELRALTGDDGGGRRLAAATRGAQRLRQHWRASAVAVTLGADGALLSHAAAAPLVLPPPHGLVPPPGADPCGAGDRFAATAAIALADGALTSEAVAAAVTEASRYVAEGGAATRRPRAEPHDVVAHTRAAGGTVVATGGCFDLLHAGHIATLEAARRLGDCLVVCLNSDASVAGLKGPGRPLTPQADRERVLRGLSCVDDVVVFDESTPEAVLSWLRPDVWVKGGDYTGAELPESALVERWGGQTVVVPYLGGRSTTATIAAVRDGGRQLEGAS